MTQAKLLISPGCQYCSTMMGLLGDLLKEGSLSQLLMINIAEEPDEATRHNVRSVPWLKIGKMEFVGAQSRTEIEKAIAMAESDNGQQEYLIDQLENGRLSEVIDLVNKDKSLIPELVALLKIEDIPMSVRIGVSAIIEEYQHDQTVLAKLLPELIELSRVKDESIRADACHFLSFLKEEEAVKRVKECREDESRMVREVAMESIDG